MGIPIDTKYGGTYISPIAATHSHCEGPQETRRSLKTSAMNDYPASPVRSLPAPSVGGQ